jgi:DNA-binding NtrC family response regulator
MILVVENDPDFRRRYKKELENEGLKVVTAANGNRAMEKVYNEPVDLVMLDLESQNEAGLEYLPKFKEAKPDIKVVATTDRPDYHWDFRFWAADAVVAPSSNLQQMKNTIDNLLS